MSTDDQPARRYSSPLRESQANRTRELILDALTELLAVHRVDEVSTKQIAERAGVSQPTVYRHFPDRVALVEGLADRVDQMAIAYRGSTPPTTVEEGAAWAEAAFKATDDHAIEATAEAVLNADPRRFSEASRRHTGEVNQAVARALPELDERGQRHFAALMRTLVSVQTWLRMREEFGMDGTESGQVVSWALRALLKEVRNGNLPGSANPDPGRAGPGQNAEAPRRRVEEGSSNA